MSSCARPRRVFVIHSCSSDAKRPSKMKVHFQDEGKERVIIWKDKGACTEAVNVKKHQRYTGIIHPDEKRYTLVTDMEPMRDELDIGVEPMRDELNIKDINMNELMAMDRIQAIKQNQIFKLYTTAFDACMRHLYIHRVPDDLSDESALFGISRRTLGALRAAIEDYQPFLAIIRKPWKDAYPFLRVQLDTGALDRYINTDYATFQPSCLGQVPYSYVLNKNNGILPFVEIIHFELEKINAEQGDERRLARKMYHAHAALQKHIQQSGIVWCPRQVFVLEDCHAQACGVEVSPCGSFVSVRKYALMEKELAGLLHARINYTRGNTLMDDRLLPEDVDDTQRKAVVTCLTNPISVIYGGAGVGKSRTIISLVRTALSRGDEVRVAAPTGVAAQRLNDMFALEPPRSDGRTLPRAVTCHKLYADSQYRLTQETWFQAEAFVNVTLILDEQSMVDMEMVTKLLSMFRYARHVVFAGDHFQLPSIGVGQVLEDLLHMDEKQVPRTHLATVYRTPGGNGRDSIIDNATVLRTWVNAKSRLTYGPSFQIVECAEMCSLTNSPDMLLLMSSYLVDQETHAMRPLVLAPTNSLVSNLNQQIQTSTVQSGSACLELKDTKWYVGEPVLALQNQYIGEKLEFANGTEGVIRQVDSNSIAVEYPTCHNLQIYLKKPIKECEEEEMSLYDCKKGLRHAYARTIHKAQGMESPVTYLWLAPNQYNNRRKLYTAITRAKSKVVIFAKSQAYVTHVCSTVGGSRKTRLVELVSALTKAPTKRQRPIDNLTQNAYRQKIIR